MKEFRQRHNQEVYQRENGSYGIRCINPDPSMAQQQFAKDCDVNHIMEKFLKTGTITHTRAAPGAYLDLVDMPDYQDSLQTVINAQNKFMELDANVRLKFDNDPGKFIEFLADPGKEKEHIAMGLRVPRKTDPVVDQLQALNKTMSSTTNTKAKSPAKKDTKTETD